MADTLFAVRRPYLLARDLFIDRDAPNLTRLEAINEPRRFVWSILPHAARTFSACITLLPQPIAEAAAVAYLYCRILDTYEDLEADDAARDEALRRFAARFHDESTELPTIKNELGVDLRDASHLLLVRRCALVDAVYRDLDPAVRDLIGRLVSDMSAGMRWSNAVFAEQDGALADEQQLARYCREVLGHPVLFCSRLLRWHQQGDASLPADVEAQALAVGEMVQLANVTRDIEKDLQRGVAYHPDLRVDLGAMPTDSGGRTERIRRVREELMIMALRRAPAYGPLLEYLSPRRLSLSRASGVLMLLFTDDYFRSCAVRAGRQPWGRRRNGATLILEALPAVWSRRWAGRRVAEIEADFLRAAAV